VVLVCGRINVWVVEGRTRYGEEESLELHLERWSPRPGDVYYHTILDPVLVLILTLILGSHMCG
jgi:hypothetical protein